MYPNKADIIARLQKDILALQGLKLSSGNPFVDVALGPIKYSFPNQTFPLGAVHEFVCSNIEDITATSGFVAAVTGMLMRKGRVSLWINPLKTIYPPALKMFGIEPDKIIFLNLKREKEILWAVEEALKCDALAAVVTEVKQLPFIASRKFQLAVEQSRVTGFILHNSGNAPTASLARWKITSLASQPTDMPGVGYPCWDIELLKVRNGKPGAWQMQWAAGQFHHITPSVRVKIELQKKAG